MYAKSCVSPILSRLRVFILFCLICLACLFGAVPSAQAQGNISGLYATGISTSGSALAGGSSDPHYQIVSAPSGEPTGAAAVTINGQFPFGGYWMADTASSGWVSPRANEDGNYEAVGSYTYQTSFTVASAATAKITGRMSADDSITAVILNGQTISGLATTGNFSVWTSFILSSGFVSGTNTLQFVVQNGGNSPSPSGLRVEMADTSTGPAPSAPTGLTATAGNASVALSWTAPSGTGTGYNIYRSTTSGGTYAKINMSAVTGTAYNDTGLTNGTTYYYVVTALSYGSESSYSNQASATPAALVNNSAFVSQSIPSSMVAGGTYSVSVTYQNTGTTTWTPIASYNLGSQDSLDNTIWEMPVNGNRALLPAGTSIAPGQNATYTFNVTAPSTAGTYPMQYGMVQDGVQHFGPLTPIVTITITSATPAPSAPIGLTATPGNASVFLSWTAPSGIVTGYNVLRGTASGGPYTSIGTSSSTTYTDSSVTNGTSYFYVVAALNGTSQSANSNEASATPTAAFGLRINAGGANYTDAGNNVWSEDEGYSGGSVLTVPNTTSIIGTSDPTLYRAQRAGASFGYTLPVPNGSYTLSLLFAEIGGDTGTNAFGVTANGVTLLSGFNIYNTAGGADTVFVQQFPVKVTNGEFSLNFAATTGTASVAAIQLLPAPFNGSTDVPPPGWAMDAVPTDVGSDSDGLGPSSSIDVSLPGGVEENTPGPDLWAYNPLGPSASYERMYRSALAAQGYGSPGLSPGWVDNYDLRVVPGTGLYTLIYPNGATETWAGVNGSLTTPPGAPYTVTASGSTLVMQFADRSAYTFTEYGASPDYPPAVYLLTKISNLVGHSITLNRDVAANSYRILSITNDAATPTTLLQFNYTSQQLASVQDVSSSNTLDASTSGGQNRQVNYAFTNGNLSNVSQIGKIGSTPADHWRYGYQALNGEPFLSTVSAPDPSVPAGTTYASASVTYAPIIDASSGAVVTAHTDANGREHTYNYGAGSVGIQVFNHVTDTAPALSWTQNFAASQNVDTGITDADNHTDTISYSGSPSPYLPSAELNRNNQLTSLTYDTTSPYGNVASVTDPRSVTTSMAYSYPSDFPLGQMSQAQTKDVNGTLLSTTTYDYYTAADTSTDGVTGVLNGLVKTAHSPWPGNTDGLSTVDTTYKYDSLGNVTEVITPGPNSTIGTQSTYTTITYSYTGFNFADYFTPTLTYVYTKAEALGEPTQVTMSGLGTAGATTTTSTYYVYDGRGNVTITLDALGDEDNYTYDLSDEPVTHTYPPTTTVTNPQRAYEQYVYQYPGGSLLSESLYDETGALFRQHTYAYGHEGELLSEADLFGPLASYTYDGLYRLMGLSDGDGHQTRYIYDSLGDLMQLAYPGYTGTLPAAAGTADTETYSYDNDQNEITRTDGRGVVTTYTRNDPESLVTQVSYSNLPSTVTPINPVVYTYDTFGRRKIMSDALGIASGAGTKTYTYDQTGAVLSLTTSFLGGPQNQALTYSYNPDGSLATQNTPAGIFGYTYDGLGRMQSASFPWNDSESYGYLANGWMQSARNRLVGTTYTYDRRGFLTNLVHINVNPYDTESQSPGGSTTIASCSGMTYDAAGNRLSAPISISLMGWDYLHDPSYDNMNDFLTYHYDARDELTEDNGTLDGLPYAYDLAYNQSQTYAGESYSNNDNQFATGYPLDGTIVLVDDFDAQGNPIGATSAYNGGEIISSEPLSFDPENRLTQTSALTIAPFHPLGPFSARYDGDGLRTVKTGTPLAFAENSGVTPPGPPITTYFLNDLNGLPVVEEQYNGNSVSVSAANGWGAAGWRERYTGGQETAYAHDPSGNVLARVTSANTVAPADELDYYEACGVLDLAEQVISGEGVAGGYSDTVYPVLQDPAGFGGEYGYYTDAETGNADLVLLGHRYYNPGLGRFLNRDPSGYSGGVNLYAFADNNPVNKSDPSGLQGEYSTPGEVTNPDDDSLTPQTPEFDPSNPTHGPIGMPPEYAPDAHDGDSYSSGPNIFEEAGDAISRAWRRMWGGGKPAVLPKVRPYNASRIPGYDQHHLEPPYGPHPPSYRTDDTIDIRNDNMPRRTPGGLNYHTGPEAFQQSLDAHLSELGYTRATYRALPEAQKRLVLRRYYSSLGIPYKK